MRHVITTICALSFIAASGIATAMPEGEFACKVQTIKVNLGVVFVQANSLGEAADVAARARVQATVPGGEKESVDTVLECIEYPGQKFQDNEFHRFVQNLPR